MTEVKGEMDTKRHLHSYKSWSHWSDQINWPKTGEELNSMHHAQTKRCCPDGSCIMLKFNCWTIFQTNGIILLTQPVLQLNCCSLTWFETLLNNYKLGLFRNDGFKISFNPSPLFLITFREKCDVKLLAIKLLFLFFWKYRKFNNKYF